MGDHTKLGAFELTDEVVVLIYRMTKEFPKEEIHGYSTDTEFQSIEGKIEEPERVLNGMIRFPASLKVFSLQPKNLF